MNIDVNFVNDLIEVLDNNPELGQRFAAVLLNYLSISIVSKEYYDYDNTSTSIEVSLSNDYNSISDQT